MNCVVEEHLAGVVVYSQLPGVTRVPLQLNPRIVVSDLAHGHGFFSHFNPIGGGGVTTVGFDKIEHDMCPGNVVGLNAVVVKKHGAFPHTADVGIVCYAPGLDGVECHQAESSCQKHCAGDDTGFFHFCPCHDFQCSFHEG